MTNRPPYLREPPLEEVVDAFAQVPGSAGFSRVIIHGCATGILEELPHRREPVHVTYFRENPRCRNGRETIDFRKLHDRLFQGRGCAHELLRLVVQAGNDRLVEC